MESTKFFEFETGQISFAFMTLINKLFLSENFIRDCIYLLIGYFGIKFLTSKYGSYIPLFRLEYAFYQRWYIFFQDIWYSEAYLFKKKQKKNNSIFLNCYFRLLKKFYHKLLNSLIYFNGLATAFVIQTSWINLNTFYHTTVDFKIIQNHAFKIFWQVWFYFS